MQQLEMNQSIDTFVEAFRFLRIRMPRMEEAKPFIGEVDNQLQKLRDTDSDWQQAKLQRMSRTAEIMLAAEDLDEEVMQISRELRAVVGGKIQDPRYKRMFPISATEMVKGIKSSQQARYMVSIINLLENDPDFTPIKAHAVTLRNLNDTVNTLMLEREALYVVENDANNARNLAKQESRDFYNHLYTRILAVSPGKKRHVNSLFYVFKRTKAVQKAEERFDKEEDSATSSTPTED